LPLSLVRNHAAVAPPGLLSEPTQVIDRSRHFPSALCQRLAIFHRNGPGNLLPTLFEVVCDCQEIVATCLGCQPAPRGKRRMSVFDGPSYGITADRRDPGERGFGRGIDRDDRFSLGLLPLSAKIKAICLHDKTQSITGDHYR